MASKREMSRAIKYNEAKAKAGPVNDLIGHVFNQLQTRNEKKAFTAAVKRFAGNLLATVTDGGSR